MRKSSIAVLLPLLLIASGQGVAQTNKWMEGQLSALRAYRDCLLKAASMYEDGISDARTIAPLVKQLCSKEGYNYIDSMNSYRMDKDWKEIRKGVYKRLDDRMFNNEAVTAILTARAIKRSAKTQSSIELGDKN